METILLGVQEVDALLSTMFERRNLVLVCGSGFTRGAKSKSGKVPSTDELKKLMLDKLEENLGRKANELYGKSFSEVAEHFLNPDFIPTSVVKRILEERFTGVVLSDSRRKFLRCPWPYIYTLNIDDAIESNSGYRTRVLPNRNLSQDIRSKVPCVFKIHGDATEELIYDEPSEIIFSTDQYVRSLSTNKSMLNAVKTDFVENNIIFVGCSLDNELDLLYALAEYHGEFPSGRRSIFVTEEKPGIFQLAKLKRHGVNTILLVSDYEDFYRKIALLGNVSALDKDEVVASLLRPSSIPTIGEDRRINLGYLLQEPRITEGEKLPYFYTARDIERQLMKAADENTITLLRGRRFSGKTLLLLHIAQSSISKNVYYFSSRAIITQETVSALLGIKNGLILFDTNVLSPAVAYSLGKGIDELGRNGTSMIVAVNRTEPDISGVFSRFVVESADFDLDSRFSTKELADLNSKLNRLGILKFESNRSILDNTFRLIKEYGSNGSTLISGREATDDEIELLLVVAVADKAHSSLATALGIRADQFFELCDRFAPVIDRADTSRSEFRDTGSRYKIVANSKVGLAYQIAYAVNARGYNWLASRLEALVGKLLSMPQFRHVANSMFMFDSINYLLTQASDGRERIGFRPVVRQVYEGLQSLLSDSPDYWLQRAKATLNVDDDEDSLIAGIEFALKAYSEAERPRTIDNAEFSIALLYGKLCAITKHENSRYVASAVEWFARALRNYHRNPDYVQRVVDETRERRSWFSLLCDHLEGPIVDPVLLTVKGDIQFLLTARRGWGR